MVNAYQFLKKYGVSIGFGLGAVLSVLTYLFILGGYPDNNPTEEQLYGTSIFDFGILSAKYLVYLGVLLIFVFFVKEAVENPQGSAKPLIMMAVLIVIYFVTQAMGDGTLTLEMLNSDASLLPAGEKFEAGISQSADVGFADGLIKFGYVLVFGAISSLVLGGLYSTVKG
jgi:uncharacterized membrane protein